MQTSIPGQPVPTSTEVVAAYSLFPTPLLPRSLPVSAATASVPLTATCRRVSILARGGAMRYMVGTGALTADASTSHYLAPGERMELSVPAGATIAAIRAAGDAAGVALEISELGV